MWLSVVYLLVIVHDGTGASDIPLTKNSIQHITEDILNFYYPPRHYDHNSTVDAVVKLPQVTVEAIKHIITTTISDVINGGQQCLKLRHRRICLDVKGGIIGYNWRYIAKCTDSMGTQSQYIGHSARGAIQHCLNQLLL